MLVGNKYDLREKCQIIPHEKIISIANSYNWKFLYCSAKEGHNVYKIFSNICESIRQKTAQKKIKVQGTKIKDKRKKKR